MYSGKYFSLDKQAIHWSGQIGLLSKSSSGSGCRKVTVMCVNFVVDSLASSGHTPINKIRGQPEDGESSSGKKC